jgi:hypothetical protein
MIMLIGKVFIFSSQSVDAIGNKLHKYVYATNNIRFFLYLYFTRQVS